MYGPQVHMANIDLMPVGIRPASLSLPDILLFFIKSISCRHSQSNIHR